MEIEWALAALLDMGQIRAYIAKENPVAADRTLAVIGAAVMRLVEHPSIGHPGRVAGTRELLVPHTPYLIPYRVRGDRIEILRVYHSARQWPSDFG